MNFRFDIFQETLFEILPFIKVTLFIAAISLVVVTHEMRFARDVSNHVIFMNGGEIVEEGTPQEVIVNPQKDRTKKFLSQIISE